MSRLSLILLSLALAVTAVAAQPEQVDIADLTFDENISTPKVHRKGAEFLRKHMASIKNALAQRHFNARLERAGEVVVVTIPCADLFAPNTCELLPGARKLLSPLATYLQYPTMYKVIVAVSSDDTGEAAYVDALTSSRAEAIEECLLSAPDAHGESLLPYGLGSDIPVQDNRSIEGRAANRRAEIYIVPNWHMINDAKSGKLK